MGFYLSSLAPPPSVVSHMCLASALWSSALRVGSASPLDLNVVYLLTDRQWVPAPNSEGSGGSRLR